MWGVLDRLSTSPPANHARTLSERFPFFPRFASKTEFLSYVLLFLVKMPFPPATRPRILSGEVAEKSPCPSPVRAADKKKSSVNYRLKQLGKKATQYKSKLPTSCAAAGHRGKSAWITTPQPDDSSSFFTNASGICSLGTSSGKSVSATSSSKGMSPKSRTPTGTSASLSTDVRSPQASWGSSGSAGNADETGEAMSFSLSLTPEAVLLLQRRSHEKQLRAARGGHGKTAHPQRELSGKSGSRSNIPLVKVSLLNDRHRYDDVEYEEAGEQAVDQRVLLKCAEWLRGVEKAAGAATLGKTVKGSQKTI